MVFNSILKFLVGVALKAYFKKIEIIGKEHIPKNTPLIVAPNHQNAFLDALLVGAFMPGDLYFLTRSDVFTKWTKPVMRWLHMLPVYRIRDGYSSLSRNEQIFKTCGVLFQQQKSVLIFPEGNHGDTYYLRPLTKGIARLGLQSLAKVDEDIRVLPVGLNYFSHRNPGHKVLIVFGPTVSVSEYYTQYKKSSGQGLTALRDAIAESMRSTLIIPTHTLDYEDKILSIFQKKNERLPFEELRSLPSSNEPQREKPSNHIFAWLFNTIPLFIIKMIISRIEDVVFHSSIKFVVGLILFPLWWAFSFIILFSFFGTLTSLVIVSLMIVSLIASYKW